MENMEKIVVENEKEEINNYDFSETVKNPFAEISEKLEKRNTIEIIPNNKEENMAMDTINELTDIRSEKGVDCFYSDCIENGFCDHCQIKCNGIIKAKTIKAQIIDQGKICFKANNCSKQQNIVGTISNKNISTKNEQKFDPFVIYISRSDVEAMINNTKAAFTKVTFDNKTFPVFFAVAEDGVIDNE